jgi:hypothetical protein
MSTEPSPRRIAPALALLALAATVGFASLAAAQGSGHHHEHASPELARTVAA